MTFGLSMMQSCFGNEFMNEFAVHIIGGHNEANRVARDTGLLNKGQVCLRINIFIFNN